MLFYLNGLYHVFSEHQTDLISRVWSRCNVVFHLFLSRSALSHSYFLLLSSVALSGDCCNSYMCVAFSTLINHAFVLPHRVQTLHFGEKHKITRERGGGGEHNTLWAIKSFLTSQFTADGWARNKGLYRHRERKEYMESCSMVLFDLMRADGNGSGWVVM